MSNSSKETLSLELFYKGQAVQQVPEYAEVEARLLSGGETALDGLSLWLGNGRLRDGIRLRPDSEFVILFNVSDMVGEVRLDIRQDSRTLTQAELTILPAKLSLDEVYWIKTERLPTLLTRLDAPNSLSLGYTDADEERTPFNFVSADFTATKLRHFCRLFLAEGLAEGLLKRLTFVTEEETRREEGFIGGQVRWQPTVQGWANRPAETGLVHQWIETSRNYTGPLNRLFVHFLQILAGQCRDLVRLVQLGAPTSARLKAGLSEFEDYAVALERSGNGQSLRAVRESLTQQPFDTDLSTLEKLAQTTSNPAYRRLVESWREFSERYVRLPPDEARMRQMGIQPMSKIYELWAACEIAYALDLTFADATQMGLESAVFRQGDRVLYYNQGAAGGWYSTHSRKQPPRPDLRLEVAGQSRLLLDVKYRQTTDRQAQPDDMYRMLAYMNDFGVRRGGIIFPGVEQAPVLKLLEQQVAGGQPGQLLAELALRPPVEGEENLLEWQTTLKNGLARLAREGTSDE